MKTVTSYKTNQLQDIHNVIARRYDEAIQKTYASGLLHYVRNDEMCSN